MKYTLTNLKLDKEVYEYGNDTQMLLSFDIQSDTSGTIDVHITHGHNMYALDDMNTARKETIVQKNRQVPQ